jgi:hypothetical protein
MAYVNFLKLVSGIITQHDDALNTTDDIRVRHLDVTGDLTVSGSEIIVGSTTFRGTVNIGDSVDDIVTITSSGTTLTGDGQLTLGSLSADKLVYSSSGLLTNTDLSGWVADFGSGNISVADDGSGGITLNTAQDIAAADSPTFAGLTVVNAITEFSTDGTLAGDSDSALPTEKAVKLYVDTELSTLSGSMDHGGLLGLGDDDHTQYILHDGTRAFTGNVQANASGTLDIGSVGTPFANLYADDVYVKGSSLHIGDNVVLSEFGTDDFGINSDIYLSKSGGPTFYVASGSDPIVFKLSGNDGPGEFQIQKYDGTKVFDVDSDGYVSTTDWVSFAANFGPRASNGQNMRFLFGDNAGATKISFTDITGGVADSEVASIDSDGNIAASGTIGWDAVQLSEYNNTDFAVNSDLRFSGAAPNIIYGAAANNPTVKIMLGEDTKGGSAHFEVRDYANNLILDINASEVAAGNSTINYRGYLINWDGDTDAHLRQAYPSKDMVFELVGTTGNTQWSFYNTNYGGDVATISADGNADFHGNVTTSGSWESSNFNTPGLNVFVGPTAGANTTTNGIRNTAVGNQALATNTDGDVNVAVGYRTMGFSGGGDFNYNTAVGGYAGFAITTGGDNVFLGAGSGQSVTTASGNIFLGREAGRFEASSNKLYIENSASSSPLIYGEFDNDLVRINGDFDVTGNVTVSGTGDFGGTVTAGGTTPEVQFSATSGTIGVSGNTDLIQLTTSGVVVDGELHVASAATGWFDDGVNFRATVTDGIITNIGTTVSGGYSMA